MEERKPVRICIIVSGAESSGNKLVRNILVDSGFTDVSEVTWIKDLQLPFVGESKIVWLRSCPHAREFPDYTLMAEILRNKGYEIYCLVPIRDWHYTIESQLDRMHVASISQSLRSIVRTYCLQFNSLIVAGIKFVPILYPDLVENPVECLRRNLALLGLSDLYIQCNRPTPNRDRQRFEKWPNFELFPIDVTADSVKTYESQV